MEFLVRIEVDVAAVPAEERQRLMAQEREVGAELVREGSLRRMWRVPGRTATVSLWQAADASELHGQLVRLPLFLWMTIDVELLADHALDPGDPEVT